jgi:hypothetical protein
MNANPIFEYIHVLFHFTSGGEEIIIEAAISTNRRILLVIIDEVINRVTVIEFILGPNVWPFEAAEVNYRRRITEERL